MIEIRNLTKEFNKGSLKALDSICCTIESNRIVGFIGPDGAGKTTLLRIMAGIMTPTSGEIVIDGRTLDLFDEHRNDPKFMSISELHDSISYMPQKFGLYEDLSVIENLELYAKLRNLSGQKKLEAFERILEMTKLVSFQKRLAGNLSGGMKQKLGLGCSLLKKPKILILDEPSVGVDPISRQDLIAMVNSMLDNETTVLWSTAYLDEAENLDHVILLDEGKVIFEGRPQKAIDDMEGRVFVFKGLSDRKRFFASELLKKEEVVDSVIQGQNVRFSIKTKDAIDSISNEVVSKFPEVQPPKQCRATFEDACVDILGGLKEKESPVAKYFEGTNFAGSDHTVEAIHLTKTFGDFKAVDDVSFKLQPGKILGLLGPNGSGKTTTFRMLCGLLIQDSGTAKIVGIDVADMGSDAKMNIGYMAQKFSLYPILSVRQNLEFFSGAYRLSGRERKEAVDSMIEIFRMQHLQDVNTGLLSLGYKQRLALACSIMHRPRVLFLDEPTSGVDPITRKEFWMHINSMVQHGISVVVTTHFMEEAENCDEIALVYKGKIEATGTPDDLKSLCHDCENPTLEQAFISIVKKTDELDSNPKIQFKE